MRASQCWVRRWLPEITVSSLVCPMSFPLRFCTLGIADVWACAHGPGHAHILLWLPGRTCDLQVGVILVAMLSPRQTRRGSFHPSPPFCTNSLCPSFIIPPLTAPSHWLATFHVTLSSLVPLPTSFVCLCFISSFYLFTSSPSFICSPCAIHLLLTLVFFPSLSDVSVAILQCLVFCSWLLKGNTRFQCAPWATFDVFQELKLWMK